MSFLGASATTSPPEAFRVRTWKAVLQVTGGGIIATAEDQDGGMIFETPEMTAIPHQYAPFQPFDLDDYVTCACDDIDWTVSGLPLGWTADIDPDNVVTISAPDGAVAPAELTFHATFHWPGIDCTGSDSAVFSPNQPPVAHPGKIYPAEKYQVVEGGSVQLDGTQSYDPDDDYIPDPALTGKATFGFVSKYKKGQSTRRAPPSSSSMPPT